MHSALNGKRILVTGGTTGIGRATVGLLAEQGARVVTFGRHQQELDDALGDLSGDVSGFTADIADRESVEAIFAEVDSRLGGLDILVANAALGAEPLADMADDDWRYVIDVNLVGYLACARAAISRMEDGGQLVFVSSISAEIKAPGESVYAATKGGINAFAETLRKEVAEKNIKVSVIEPGTVGSDMQESTPEEQREKIARHEMLQAEEIAEAIAFVLSRSERCDVVMLRIEPRLQKIA
jgi:3-hydroxy acid dehydrogenase / malonic semialdehyde reductase